MSPARAFSIAVSLVALATPALAQCEWQWRNFDAEASSTVRTFRPWDVDGDGVSELFVGGSFSEIGGVSVNGLAVWDGVEFSEFADALFLSVHDLVEFRGELFCVGNSSLYRWTGTEWEYIESAPFPISGLLVHDDNLIVHGSLTRCIRRWDGSVTELGEFNGQLVLVGNFDEPFESVAFWDGQSFSGLGRGICEDGLGDTAPFAIAEYNGDLLVGGSFSQVDRLPIKNFGIWTYAPDGDANGDLKVDLSDLGLVLRSYSTCNGNPLYDPAAGRLGDNGNNCVDLEDLGEVLASWGASCE